jgi:hypothetical protein
MILKSSKFVFGVSSLSFLVFLSNIPFTSTKNYPHVQPQDPKFRHPSGLTLLFSFYKNLMSIKYLAHPKGKMLRDSLRH